jgi:dynein heavy chain 2
VKLDYDQEALILIKSIRVNTISKLTYGDSYKYEYLQRDMFPSIQTKEIDYGKLVDAIKESLSELKLLYIEK